MTPRTDNQSMRAAKPPRSRLVSLNDDLNGADQEGIYSLPSHAKDGQRCSARRRPMFHHSDGATAKSVEISFLQALKPEFDGVPVAVGDYANGKRRADSCTNKEII
jgi:hypothetical protein